MAVLFDPGSAEYLRNDSSPAVVYPIAFALWGKSDSATTEQTGVAWVDQSSGTETFALYFAGNVSGDKIRAQIRADAGVSFNSDTTTGYTAGTWHHAAATFVDNGGDRTIESWIDGGSNSPDTNTAAPVVANFDRIAIGARADSTVGQHFSGHIAEVAVWFLADWPGATGADKAAFFAANALPALAAGASPLFFPVGLTYWPLPSVVGIQDRMGVYDMTAFNTPATSEHPPIVYPNSMSYVHAVAAVGGGVSQRIRIGSCDIRRGVDLVA